MTLSGCSWITWPARRLAQVAQTQVPFPFPHLCRLEAASFERGHGLHVVVCLNMWPPVSDAVLESYETFGGWSLFGRSMSLWGRAFTVYSLSRLPVLSAFFVRLKCDRSLSLLLQLPVATLPCHEDSNPSKLFIYKSLLVMVFYHSNSNRKVIQRSWAVWFHSTPHPYHRLPPCRPKAAAPRTEHGLEPVNQISLFSF